MLAYDTKKRNRMSKKRKGAMRQHAPFTCQKVLMGESKLTHPHDFLTSY